MKLSDNIFKSLTVNYPSINVCLKDICAAHALILECYKNGGKVLVCGNGGSAADSEHIVGELMKGFNLARRLDAKEKARFLSVTDGEYIASRLQGALPAISLVSQTGLISAFANDVDPALVYAQQVYAYANSSHDVLIALSTSGNSANVVYAAETARAMGIKIVSITGEKGGPLAEYSDVCVKIPMQTPFEIQELSLPVYHAICAMVEADMFDN